MKIQVLHDQSGQIHGFLAHTAKRKGVLLPEGQDRMVTEVDVPELDFELTRENRDQAIESIATILGDRKVSGGRLIPPGR
jgi:hypothetical protein